MSNEDSDKQYIETFYLNYSRMVCMYCLKLAGINTFVISAIVRLGFLGFLASSRRSSTHTVFFLLRSMFWFD
jgi:predicted signal transduction protein with EAL and GGDEF domain